MKRFAGMFFVRHVLTSIPSRVRRAAECRVTVPWAGRGPLQCCETNPVADGPGRSLLTERAARQPLWGSPLALRRLSSMRSLDDRPPLELGSWPSERRR